MSDRDEGNDSDAPEEFTSEQGIQLDEEIRKVQKENKARIVREVKERRRQWALKKTPRPSEQNKSTEEVTETDDRQESQANRGMLPTDIVELLAARDKHIFSSDNEEENPRKKPSSKKKRFTTDGVEPVILKDLPPPKCVQKSLKFLKKRKMQVPRSPAVLNNSNQALRLLSASGLLNKK